MKSKQLFFAAVCAVLAINVCAAPTLPKQWKANKSTISVAADGSPSSGEITQSSGNSALDRHALRWVLRHWHFHPARRNNSPCESRVLTTLHFTL